ncbi:MAG: hypothetical protein V3V96_16840 [Acidiferrobacterales bacterium]
MSECIYDSATSLAKAIRGKQLSAVEVMRAHLERMAAVNGQLNAVVQLASVRAGATTDNLPIGVQIVRRRRREDGVRDSPSDRNIARWLSTPAALSG